MVGAARLGATQSVGGGEVETCRLGLYHLRGIRAVFGPPFFTTDLTFCLP